MSESKSEKRFISEQELRTELVSAARAVTAASKALCSYLEREEARKAASRSPFDIPIDAPPLLDPVRGEIKRRADP